MCHRPPTKQTYKLIYSNHENNFHWSPLKIKEDFSIKILSLAANALFIYLHMELVQKEREASSQNA